MQKKILFIHDSEKIKEDINENLYTDGSYTMNVWKRYIQKDNILTVIARKDKKIYSFGFADKYFQKFSKKIINFVALEDISDSIQSFINIKKRKYNRNLLTKEILKNDYIILRVPNGYENAVIDICSKYNKKLLLEVVGCPFGALWYHSLRGKVLAIPAFFNLKRAMKKANLSVYVTNKFLQNRYPSRGLNFCCSDVEIQEANHSVLDQRIKKIAEMNCHSIHIGTIGSIDVKYKGQEYVIEAILRLKKQNINIVYELVGGNNGKYLRKLIKKLHIEENIVFKGQMGHDEVFEWLKKIDIYIQPSLTEGLPRSVIEAMSVGCPVLGSDVGGIPELIPSGWVFHRKNSHEIATKIREKIDDKQEMTKVAKMNFEGSFAYSKDFLEEKRQRIYKDFFEM